MITGNFRLCAWRQSPWVVAIACLTPVCAHAGTVGLQLGEYDSYRDATLTYYAGPILTYKLASKALDVGVEGSAGRASAPRSYHHDLWHVGVGPAVKYWLDERWAIDYSLTANAFSGTHLGDKNISTTFQFGNSLGLLHRFAGSPWEVGVRITHYSNADIKKPNPGQNYLQLRAAYAFN